MRRFSGVLLSFLLSLSLAGLALPASAEAPGGPASRVVSPVAGITVVRAGAVVETRVIGRSVAGRPIVAWRLGNPASPRKAVFLATIHGSEAAPARILANLRDGRKITGADIWVVPYLNPDGYALHSRRNAHGVDLNRNFPSHWIRQFGSFDSGPAPASEPETQAVMAFLNEVRPRWVVSFHQPLYGVDRSYAKNRRLALRLSRYLHLPRKHFTCNNGCHGTLTQWFNATYPGRAITVEYGAHMSRRQKQVTGPRGLLRTVHATR
jgi:protein MpaA